LLYVKKLRLSYVLSQEKCASLAKIHRNYMGMIERGEKNVTLDVIIRLSKVLRTNPGSILSIFDK
jgi:transcriptional regulator with XRE-family HTH domain